MTWKEIVQGIFKMFASPRKLSDGDELAKAHVAETLAELADAGELAEIQAEWKSHKRRRMVAKTEIIEGEAALKKLEVAQARANLITSVTKARSDLQGHRHAMHEAKEEFRRALSVLRQHGGDILVERALLARIAEYLYPATVVISDGDPLSASNTVIASSGDIPMLQMHLEGEGSVGPGPGDSVSGATHIVDPAPGTGGAVKNLVEISTDANIALGGEAKTGFRQGPTSSDAESNQSETEATEQERQALVGEDPEQDTLGGYTPGSQVLGGL